MARLSYAFPDGEFDRPMGPMATLGDPLRSELSIGARRAWDSPTGQARREQLRAAARGPAGEMSRAIAPFRAQISNAFRRVGPSLSTAYRSIWSGYGYESPF
ncbi:MAG: hypothetical protein WCB18_07125 [Thermoplasmata archaeon]